MGNEKTWSQLQSRTCEISASSAGTAPVMNHIYRLVFNSSAGVCQAVPEVAFGSSAGQASRPRRARAAAGSSVQMGFLATAVTVAIATTFQIIDRLNKEDIKGNRPVSYALSP